MKELMINNFLYPNAGGEMYIVKMPENSVFMALFEKSSVLQEQF